MNKTACKVILHHLSGFKMLRNEKLFVKLLYIIILNIE